VNEVRHPSGESADEAGETSRFSQTPSTDPRRGQGAPAPSPESPSRVRSADQTLRVWQPAPLVFERSRPGRRAGRPPRPELPVPELPGELKRKTPPRLPEVSEPELVRHFTALADRTFGVDTGFYPLGSCTMKHNPRVHERLAALPGFRDLHPHQEDEGAQGALELMWRLQEMLAEIAGLPAVTLQPAAGSQGELTGLMLMRAYFDDRGEERDTIITADTAHGTNPASVTMAGYKLERVETDARGNLDLDDLRAKVSQRTAGLMLTNPSTLGLFDEGIEEVATIFHDAGALLYYDGANLNAVVGISRPGDMGFDIVHYNLHKTFSQPHGGGGPGGGPVAVRDTIERFLPVPRVVRDGDAFRLDSDHPKSIGRVRGFAGPFGVFVRSYAFMRAYGPALREMSEVSVLNANYLLARLKDVYDLPYDRLCMHEFVLSARNLKRQYGITALDVAKRLMDYGIHPPTIYFPLVVAEALMIEPTETEPKERLDDFIEAMRRIAQEAADSPETLKEAPYLRPVRRLDEVRAVKQPVVRYAFGEREGATAGAATA
jgi:glycine dehydrogenase subunit 2